MFKMISADAIAEFSADNFIVTGKKTARKQAEFGEKNDKKIGKKYF